MDGKTEVTSTHQDHMDLGEYEGLALSTDTVVWRRLKVAAPADLGDSLLAGLIARTPLFANKAYSAVT